MKKDEAIHSCKPLCHPATAPLVMGAHQSSEPARASQQPLPPKHRRAAPGSGRTEPTCREHAQQREQRQQRGNEKLGKQDLKRHFTELRQLQRQISEQSRHKYGQNLG